MGKCRPDIGPQILAALAALGLVACAQLAGLDDSGRGGTSKTHDTTSDDSLPADKSLGGDESAKSDQNAEDLAVDLKEIDFGAVNCQTESKRTELKIRNLSDKGRKFTVTIPEDAPFRIEGVAGSVLQGDLWAKGEAKVELYVKPNSWGIVKSSAVVASDGAFITVPLGVRGEGPQLEWATQLADVGETPLNTDGVLTVKLKNTGPKAGTISKFDLGANAGNAFSVSPSYLTIGAGAEADITVKLAKGSTVSSKLSTTVTPIAFGQCSPSPPVEVTGQRIDSTVTVNGADFGRQPCNSTPTDKKSVVIKNYYNKPVNWTLKTSLTKYTLASASSGTVAAANGAVPSQSTITFSAPALGMNLGTLEEEVTITLEAPAGVQLPASAVGDRRVKLKTDVRGAILRVNNTSFSFTAKIGESAKNDFKVFNDGNEVGKVYWEYTRTEGDVAWTNLPGTTTTYGGSTTTTKITYTPKGPPPNSAQLVPVQATGGYKICNLASLPAKITLSGTDGAPPPPPPEEDAGAPDPNDPN